MTARTMDRVPQPVQDARDAAKLLARSRLISAEFLHAPRPPDPDRRAVLDFALRSRLRELRRYESSAVLLLSANDAGAESILPLLAEFPDLRLVHARVNPPALHREAGEASRDTPFRCGWADPDAWTQMAYSDRWARIGFALEVGAHLAQAGEPGSFLIMPAHDAIWGRGLLRLLIDFSLRHARAGVPAGVSPCTPHQHSRVPGAAVPEWGIRAVNAAFGRDYWRRVRLAKGDYQGFWGKTGLLPFAACECLLNEVDRRVWEDDLEIDRALRACGIATRGLWIANRTLYRQALPIFNEAELRRLIDRTLHYSLHIPAATLGGSSLLLQPLALPLRLQRLVDGRYRRALDDAERLTAECQAAAQTRVARCGRSWVDWGAFRCVAAVGDPFVQVWFHNDRL